MPTQIERAKSGIVTKEMEQVAKDEGFQAEEIRKLLAQGKLIIPANINHRGVVPKGIGSALLCKVNANIGNSALSSNLSCELEKLKVALLAGADAVMDLSTGEMRDEIRAAIIKSSPVPIGTVPIYQAAGMVEKIEELEIDQMFDVIEQHASDGVDFITVHCGLLREHIPLAQKRTTGIVSRGGALLARWMTKRKKQNPLYEHFDRLLEICHGYDVSLSLGDGLRPGSLADASDEAQFEELKVLGELTKRAREKNVQAMVEGPGHIPLNQIEMNVKKQIELCDGAPFYVLGPLVTDIGAGHDHIVSAIGGTFAAYCGVAMLCYVTPKEHLGLPNADDVHQGIIAHRIAAHAGDIAAGKRGARQIDDELSRARFNLDWEKQFSLLIDPQTARKFWKEAKSQTDSDQPCSMCGANFCAMKITKELG